MIMNRIILIVVLICLSIFRVFLYKNWKVNNKKIFNISYCIAMILGIIALLIDLL